MAVSFRDGDLSGLSGEQILDSVKSGRLWLNIGNLSAHYPAFKALTSRLFAEIAHSKPDFAPIKPVENLLVSSPKAVVSFHADPNPVMLLQCQGRKRLWIYPARDERVLAREHLEQIITRQWEGWEIPYRAENEQHSVAYDLGPGDFISWAHNSPHRVVNYDEVNVAITIEYLTRRSRRKTAVYRANAFLRQKLGMTPKSTQTEGLVPLLKILSIVALRRSGMFEFDQYKPVTTFRVDPQSTNGFRNVPSTPLSDSNRTRAETPTWSQVVVSRSDAASDSGCDRAHVICRD